MPRMEIQEGIPSHSRFPALDGYRAIAAFMVLTTHVAFNSGIVVVNAWGHVFHRFDFGVTLFFVISGFLLYRPWSRSAMLNRESPSTATYAARRILRVVPAWFIAALVVLATLPSISPSPVQWACNLTLTQIYVNKCSVNGMTQMWSLAVELAFYAILPAIAYVAGRIRRGRPDASMLWQFAVVTAVALIGWAYGIAVASGALDAIPLAHGWLPRYLDWFAAGMVLAICVTRLSLPEPPAWIVGFNRAARDAWVWVAIAIALFVISCTPLAGGYTLAASGGWSGLLKHLLYLGAAMALIVPGVLGRRENGSWGRFLTSPQMVFLGTISYGVFLWHQYALEMIMWAADVQLFNGNFILLLIPTVFISVTLGWLSWVIVERPAIRLSHRSARIGHGRTTSPSSGDRRGSNDRSAHAATAN